MCHKVEEVDGENRKFNNDCTDKYAQIQNHCLQIAHGNRIDVGKLYTKRIYNSVPNETHHWDDVGDAVTTVDDGARQRPLSHLSGRPGCC